MYFQIFFIIFGIFVSSSAFDLPRQKCSSKVKIGDQHYILSGTIDIHEAYPVDAHYDVNGNLFFVKSGIRNEEFCFDIYFVKLNCKAAVKVEGLPDAISYSVAIDKKNSKVYFGTGQGIYEYDYETSMGKPYSSKHLKLNMIFVDKDGNKYVTETNNGIEQLYLLDDMNEKIRFPSLEALNELGINDNEDFYFIKYSKLYVLRSNSSEAVAISEIDYDGIAQINFHESKVFVASKKLTYFDQNQINPIYTVENIPEKVTALAFDGVGNFILGTKGKLLQYRKHDCYFRSSE